MKGVTSESIDIDITPFLRSGIGINASDVTPFFRSGTFTKTERPTIIKTIRTTTQLSQPVA